MYKNTEMGFDILYCCNVLTPLRLAYLCCQCDTSLDVKLALIWQQLEMSGEGIFPSTEHECQRVTQNTKDNTPFPLDYYWIQ